MSHDWILPDWPAPARVKALVTTRSGGVSRPPFTSLNLADHVGDDLVCVMRNRAILRAALPSEPVWLQQVHGITVCDADGKKAGYEADASVAHQTGSVCAILTADCLPVLFCDCEGTVVAGAHAGWRGLAGGVLENTIAAMQKPPEQIIAWLGPAIGAQKFEVGNEVREIFINLQPEAETAFVAAGSRNQWFADIYALARLRLRRAGICQIYGGGACTYSDPKRFYSYRREGVTGRMVSLIWLVDDDESDGEE